MDGMKLPETLRSAQGDTRAVILSPSLPVILSEAKNLDTSLRVNSAKNLGLQRIIVMP